MPLLKRLIFLSFTLMVLAAQPAYATALSYTVNTSENVTVTGTPRLTLTIGATTRYATYASGSGTNALVFSYTPVAGDFDADGVAVASPVDLNGGTMTDAAGNNLTLTYTPTATPNVKVQAYTPAFTTTPVDDTNKTAVAFNIAGAPVGSTYNYTITSSGGGGNVIGSGSIAADPHAVTGLDVSALPTGTLTVSVTITAASGTGTAKTDTASYTTAFTGVLDGLPSISAAFSVRRLASSYTGPILRVRRSSDNSEQNIGYDASGNLDTVSLTSFCGSGSCFIRTWYDQSGNGDDAVQTTPSRQPRIVNAGTIETLNARPSIVYDGTSSGFLAQATGAMGPMTTLTIVGVFKMTTNKGMQMFDIRETTGVPVLDEGNTDGFAARRRNDAGVLISTATMTKNTTPHVTSIIYDGTTLSHSLDGGTANTASSTGVTSGNFTITFANNGFSTVTSSFNGQIPEFIYFPSVISTANRQAVEMNQKAYFSTP